MDNTNTPKVSVNVDGMRNLFEHAKKIDNVDKWAELALDWMQAANKEIVRLNGLLNTPELHNFQEAVIREALHQRQRWGSAHDAGKNPEDWFWLLGYLGGKALHAQKVGDTEKALHHTVSTAAACANWHAAMLGKTDMRPGIMPPEGESQVPN